MEKISIRRKNAVRFYREQKGMTLEQLALLLPARHGKPRGATFVHRLETGGCAKITGDIARSIAEILDIPPDEEIFEEVRN
jgi:transcriptional regulator with XRE-family HTH domain